MVDIKVSVIIPIFNADEYLEECLDSVFSQTLREIEIICINDGSTDKSLDILLKYEMKYSNMILISISNHGVGYARNIGIREAQGDACCFIDPDDKYPSNDTLECLYNKMKEKGVLICGGSARLLMNGTIVEHLNPNRVKYRFDQEGEIEYKDYQWSYGFWRFMYDREFLLSNGIFFPDYIRYQDPPFFVKAMILSKIFYAIKKDTYTYRLGYKRLEYTLDRTKDCLKGMIDVLNMSRMEGLRELHSFTLDDINNSLCTPIFRHLRDGDKELKQLLDNARKEIDFNWVKNEAGDSYIFEAERRLGQSEMLKQEEEQLLYMINRFKDIIIYGAGNVGKKVVEYLLKKDSNYNLRFAVTKKDISDAEYMGIEIKEIKEFTKRDKEDALVLIATTERYQEEISYTLKKEEFRSVIKINFSKFKFYSYNFI